MAKKKKKKRGCVGTLINLIIGLICLVVTALIVYFAWLVVNDTPETDPVEEFKKLPEQLKALPETIQDFIDKKKSGDSEPVPKSDPAPGDG